MTKTLSLKAVPLPEVPNVTDELIFGGLALPNGFDDERLLVNVAAFNRVRLAAGLGMISVGVVSGESMDFTPSVNSVDASGTATVGAAAKRDKRSFTQGSVTFPTDSTMYDKPRVNLKIDGAVLDQKLEAEGGPDGHVIVRDPVPRAKVLNSAVRQGLLAASKDANFDLTKAKTTAWMYGWFYSMGLMAGNGLEHSAITTAMISPLAPVMNNMASVRLALERNYPIRDILSRLRQSYFVGLTPDRYIAAAGIISTSRFMKAAK